MDQKSAAHPVRMNRYAVTAAASPGAAMAASTMNAVMLRRLSSRCGGSLTKRTRTAPATAWTELPKA